MAAASSSPPDALPKLPSTEGILQKQGGGSSFLGSRGWTPRYVRIDDGVMRYWKTKRDMVDGGASLKDIGIRLADYVLDWKEEGEDGFFGFSIVAKEGASIGESRSRYNFRVHRKEDRDGWVKLFRACGCAERGYVSAAAVLKQEAFDAALPEEVKRAVNVAKTGKGNRSEFKRRLSAVYKLPKGGGAVVLDGDEEDGAAGGGGGGDSDDSDEEDGAVEEGGEEVEVVASVTDVDRAVGAEGAAAAAASSASAALPTPPSGSAGAGSDAAATSKDGDA